MKIKISIILVSYNAKFLLDQCLQSIYTKSQNFPNPFEIIVVDNCSQDGSPEFLKHSYPEITLIENKENLGFGRANNQAVNAAQGEYLLLINSDTIADCNLVEEALKFFEQHTDNKSAFGGLLINPDGSEQRGCRRSFPTLTNSLLHFTKIYKIITYKRAYDLSGRQIETHELECVSGACIGMPKAMYQELGGFDEIFFLHFEDIDLCKRIWQSGYKLWFYPNLRLIHHKGGSSNSSQEIKINVNKWFLESLAKYLWKWDKPSAVLFSPILGFLMVLGWFQALQTTKSQFL